jgi:hypothetical protein
MKVSLSSSLPMQEESDYQAAGCGIRNERTLCHWYRRWDKSYQSLTGHASEKFHMFEREIAEQFRHYSPTAIRG